MSDDNRTRFPEGNKYFIASVTPKYVRPLIIKEADNAQLQIISSAQSTCE